MEFLKIFWCGTKRRRSYKSGEKLKNQKSSKNLAKFFHNFTFIISKLFNSNLKKFPTKATFHLTNSMNYGQHSFHPQEHRVKDIIVFYKSLRIQSCSTFSQKNKIRQQENIPYKGIDKEYIFNFIPFPIHIHAWHAHLFIYFYVCACS